MIRFSISPSPGNKQFFTPPINYWLFVYLGFRCNQSRGWRLFSTKRLTFYITIYGLPPSKPRRGDRTFTVRPSKDGKRLITIEHDQLDA